MLKKFGIFIVLFCLLISTNTVFASNNTYNQETNESINYWKGRFDDFDKQINNGNLGELVSSSEVYVKYTPKSENIDLENATEDDFNTEVYDKEDYLIERFKEENSSNGINTFAIGPFEPNGTSSWLRLDLQVYTTSKNGVYTAISFWEWKTDPQFRLRDINGIYVSSEFIIGTATASNPKIANFRYRDTNNNWTSKNPSVSISQFGNGAAASFNLPGDSSLFDYNYFMGMLQVPVEFSNTGSISGRIYTSYAHTRVSLGDISFDNKGKPSFGLTSTISEFSGSVKVDR